MMNMEEVSKKRPFFSSPEELFDDEYYDEQMPEKKRRLTADQVHLLEESFEAQNKLEPERKSQLAKKLGLQPRQVAVWFQNRRARSKTKQLERDYDLLKASYDSLLSNFDNLVKENEMLKAEVFSLTEKTQDKEVIMAPPVSVQKPDASLFKLVLGNLSEETLNVKVEDRVSSGSIESAVVDDGSPQLVDSGDSYLPNDIYGGGGYVIPASAADGLQSEEDDGSDDGSNYFSQVFVVEADEHQQQEQNEELGWWVWS